MVLDVLQIPVLVPVASTRKHGFTGQPSHPMSWCAFLIPTLPVHVPLYLNTGAMMHAQRAHADDQQNTNTRKQRTRMHRPLALSQYQAGDDSNSFLSESSIRTRPVLTASPPIIATAATHASPTTRAPARTMRRARDPDEACTTSTSAPADQHAGLRSNHAQNACRTCVEKEPAERPSACISDRAMLRLLL
jgi:hypothetical protein